jgi:hypothetical protein
MGVEGRLNPLVKHGRFIRCGKVCPGQYGCQKKKPDGCHRKLQHTRLKGLRISAAAGRLLSAWYSLARGPFCGFLPEASGGAVVEAVATLLAVT